MGTDRQTGNQCTDTACNLLGLTPEERAGLQSALQHAGEGEWLRVERAEPSGEVVARYTAQGRDAGFEQSVSNKFALEIAGVVGAERADLLLPGAWREFKSQAVPGEAETMTIRRAVVDGEPDLIYEMKRGDSVWTQPVRYAHYPSSWFLTVFPGGWDTPAQREGFDLPKRFRE